MQFNAVRYTDVLLRSAAPLHPVIGSIPLWGLIAIEPVCQTRVSVRWEGTAWLEAESHCPVALVSALVREVVPSCPAEVERLREGMPSQAVQTRLAEKPNGTVDREEEGARRNGARRGCTSLLYNRIYAFTAFTDFMQVCSSA